MPRTVREILDRADELAERFEAHAPDQGAIKEAAPLRAVRVAFLRRAEAERVLTEAIAAARKAGHSWASIGTMVGTTGEAARQRYGRDS